MPAAVNAAHLVEMPLKMPIPQELPENLLLHARHRRRIKSADGAVTLHQLLWKHHITDTQRRRDTFGKCSKINFDETWGDKLELATLLEHGKEGRHTVTIRLAETHEDDAVPFYLVSVIAAGRRGRD